jgi:hypothetical protein
VALKQVGGSEMVKLQPSDWRRERRRGDSMDVAPPIGWTTGRPGTGERASRPQAGPAHPVARPLVLFF